MTRSLAVRRSAMAYGALALVIAVVLLPVWLIIVGPLWGSLLSLVVGASAAALLYLRSDAIALRAIGARPADEGEHPRLENLVEGLTVAHGFRSPDLYVIDDGAANAAVVGRTPRHGAIAVTSGLLDRLGVVELEAVLAHELARIRTGEAAVNVSAATLAGPLAAVSVGLASSIAERIVEGTDVVAADLASTDITRYPPGLTAALVSIERDGRFPAADRRAYRHLWFNTPPEPLVQSSFSLGDRIAVLDEL